MGFIVIKKDDVLGFDIPMAVDLSTQYQRVVVNQRSIPMCLPCAWVSFVEYQRQIQGYPFKAFSRMYLYYYARYKDGHSGLNTQVSVQGTISALIDGIPEERDWPMGGDIRLEPPQEIRMKARTHVGMKIQGEPLFEKLTPCPETFKYILGFCGRPIVCNLHINRQQFEEHQLDVLRTSREPLITHCVLVVGYNETDSSFIFQNSYGEEWGRGGFGRFGYELFEQGRVTSAFSMPICCIKGVDEIDEGNNSNEADEVDEIDDSFYLIEEIQKLMEEI